MSNKTKIDSNTKLGKCPSRLRWFLSGIVWDIAFLFPLGSKPLLFLIQWSGMVYAWATYEEMVAFYRDFPHE